MCIISKVRINNKAHMILASKPWQIIYNLNYVGECYYTLVEKRPFRGLRLWDYCEVCMKYVCMCVCIYLYCIYVSNFLKFTVVWVMLIILFFIQVYFNKLYFTKLKTFVSINCCYLILNSRTNKIVMHNQM